MSRHDRTKSGGFLDTIFSKSSKRGSSNQHNGKNARPTSTNETEVMDAQELENKILRMTVEEINREFNLILDDMNLNSEKRAPLMLKNLEERRDMIRFYSKG